ncbi:hypothetical protein DCO17_02035 [Polynucleobacter tropicus]|uniref:Uncharacterized protein n=1 Tax=Polynucleobacter tropicus TaxID=1743174 RepID=A0A6M9PT70_9BURK|nr:hypothetical protein DCO17_02035 [Polynucleobacter tropicus]
MSQKDFGRFGRKQVSKP